MKIPYELLHFKVETVQRLFTVIFWINVKLIVPVGYQYFHNIKYFQKNILSHYIMNVKF